MLELDAINADWPKRTDDTFTYLTAEEAVANYNPNHGEMGRFVSQSMDNLVATSRTAKGTVDTSATAEKSSHMAVGGGEATAELAKTNFKAAAQRVYAAKDQDFSDPTKTLGFVDSINRQVSAGITKEGSFLRTDDGKHPYAPAAELPAYREQFAEEFSRRLSDPKADPVETAAWAEFRTQRDHAYADGCGKTAKLLAGLALARGGVDVPKYRSTMVEHLPKVKPTSPTDTTGLKEFTDAYKGMVNNAFCPTGPGGGVDPSCSPPGAKDSKAMHTDANGNYTPERAAFHQKLVAAELEGHKPVDNPVVVMTGGGSAAGKSTMIKRLDLPKDMVKADPDALMMKQPEFQAMMAAHDHRASQANHAESGDVGDMVTDAAVAGKYNLLIDGTGDTSLARLVAHTDHYRENGAKVIGHYLTTDIEAAVKANRDRAEKAEAEGRPARWVPDSVVRATHRGVAGILPTAMRQGVFDECTLWDRDGDTMTKVAHSVKGEGLQVLDQAKWEKFLGRAYGGS